MRRPLTFVEKSLKALEKIRSDSEDASPTRTIRMCALTILGEIGNRKKMMIQSAYSDASIFS